MPRRRSRAASATWRASSTAARDGRERLPVGERPAEVLGVGQLEASGAEMLLGQRHELADAGDVAAVEDDVERERQPQGRRRGRGFHLRLEVVAPGNPGGAVRVAVLDGELQAVEPRGRQAGQARRVGRDAAGDEVDVEVALPGRRHQRLQILAHQRLAAGQVDLHDAERGGLGEDARPVVGRQLRVVARKLQRVGAVRTRERTAVGQLGDQRVGARDLVGRHGFAPAAGRGPRARRRNASTSSSICLRAVGLSMAAVTIRRAMSRTLRPTPSAATRRRAVVQVEPALG